MKRRDFIKLGSVVGAGLIICRTGVFASAPSGRNAAGAKSRAGTGNLAEDFSKVPDAARPGCYWWWLDGRVNRQGITRDLEEFAAKGMGSVLLVNSTNLGPKSASPQDGCRFLSSEWRALYRHAINEASRLGIEVGVNLCGGWAMGGPWIQPKDSGRWFLQSRITVEGPTKFSAPLPLPGNRDGYDKVFNPPGWKDYVDLPLEKLDYRDTCIVAFPDPDGGSEQSRFSGKRAELLSAKTNRRDASNFTRARDVMGPTLEPWEKLPTDKPVAPDQVVDLTARVGTDGKLEWDVPAGRWTIVRTGHRMTGSRLMIAPPEADGLSVDWLAAYPVDVQFEHLGKVFLEEAGEHVGTTLKYFCDDSFEDGFPNWTDAILKKFEEYRGYNPRPYLPVLAGYIIGSAEIADRFLYDYRKTVADCMADGHYKRFAELCHEQGMLVQNESAGPSRSGTMCMDGLKNLGRSDRPMGEFWMGTRHNEPGGLAPELGYGVTRLEDGQNKVTKMVSSAAHIYGRKTASAESFTTMRHWQDSPGMLKQAADRAFCEGINQLVVHTSTASRPEDGKPGYEYYAGTHFNPNVTWWHHAGAFLAYLGRCHHLLQQGLFVADVLRYNGDWAPNIVPPKYIDPSLGFGYDYDACNAEVLLTRLSVRGGRLVLPDGMSYRVLVLPETNRMPLEVIQKIRDLVKAGATISGPRPQGDPGLKNYPKCDEAVEKIAAEIWGDCDGKTRTMRKYGRGRVYCGAALKTILTGDGISPDFQCLQGGKENGELLDFIHRSTAAEEIYFVANRTNASHRVECCFRVEGRVPELWDAISGTRRSLRNYRVAAGCTSIPDVEFAPFQSYFIVFPKKATIKSQPKYVGADFPVYATAQELSGSWQVSFDPEWGGPASIAFDKLVDWTARPETGIKYYSGSGRYTKRFNYKPVKGTSPERVYLDLGVVNDIAGVKLNGRDLGTIWTAPWCVDISDAIVEGENLVEIEVVNEWRNRLIGDAALPQEKRVTRTNIPIDVKSPLLPSGLLGPVVIKTTVS